MKLKFTLDTNCIYAVEESRPERRAIERLLRAHQDGQATVSLVAISASEAQREGQTVENFEQFKTRVHALGFEGVEFLMPIMYWDVCFWDYSYWADKVEPRVDEESIHRILFPNMPFDYQEYVKALQIDPFEESVAKKWKNAKCDVQAFWSHAHHNHDVFVTSDGNFHAATKRPALLKISGGSIEKPDIAAERFRE